MATVDLNNRKKKEDRIPLRAHLNLGYLFDGSGKLVDSVEAAQGHRITRIERFGLGINRVDSFNIGLGVEGIFDIVRPFLEWTIDVPVNRQDHVCDNALRAAGDQCLGNAAGFSTTPSRVTLGARVYPWLEGLSLLAAIDIGTGATSSFIEEVVPEMPWNLHFGLAYAVDTQPRVEVRRIESKRAPPPEPPKLPHIVLGTVVEKGSNTPIPDALVRFDGRAVTGMITMADGTFRTGDLDPGTYTFDVSATGYRDGQCSATIGFGAPGVPAYGAPAAQPGVPGAYQGTDLNGTPIYGAPGQPQPPAGPYGAAPAQPGQPGQPGAAGGPAPSATVVCELEAQAKVGNVNGQLRDAETSAAVGGAAVKITDKNWTFAVTDGGRGGLVPVRERATGAGDDLREAPNYLRAVVEVEVKPRGDVSAQIAITKRPKLANVVVTDKELKLKKEVHFQHDSAERSSPTRRASSRRPPTHSGRTPRSPAWKSRGTPTTRALPSTTCVSAASARTPFARLSSATEVEPTRLTARGYGQEKPLVPTPMKRTRRRTAAFSS